MIPVHSILQIVLSFQLYMPSLQAAVAPCTEVGRQRGRTMSEVIGICGQCNRDNGNFSALDNSCVLAAQSWCQARTNFCDDRASGCDFMESCANVSCTAKARASNPRTYFQFADSCDSCQNPNQNSLLCAQAAVAWCVDNNKCGDCTSGCGGMDRSCPENPDCGDDPEKDCKPPKIIVKGKCEFQKPNCTAPMVWNGSLNKCEEPPCLLPKRRIGAECLEPDPDEPKKALAQCESYFQQAQSTCNSNPIASRADARDGGMQAICEEYNRSGRVAAQGNIDWGNSCTSAYRTCKDKCQEFAQTFTSMSATLNSFANRCQSLQAKVQQTGHQNANTLSAADLARDCAKDTASSNPYANPTPQSVKDNDQPNGNNQPGGSDGLGSSPASQSRAYNQAYDSTSRTVTDAAKGAAAGGGQSHYRANSPAPRPQDFNVGDVNDTPQTQRNSDEKARANGGGARNATVANNSGGPMPGGGGSGSAQLGSKRGTSAGAPGYSTDVLQGFQNGGGGDSSFNGSGSGFADDGGSGNFGNSNRAVAGRGKPEKGMDLKNYLPGGSLAANGRYTGGYGSSSLGIHGPNIVLWDRINLRMLERCKLGQLLDCR